MNRNRKYKKYKRLHKCSYSFNCKTPQISRKYWEKYREEESPEVSQDKLNTNQSSKTEWN